MAQNEIAKKNTCTDQPGHGTVVDNITPRQKLIIAKGLIDYQYIMDNREKNDDDFQDVYYDFYLKARGEMWNVDHRSVYFELLKTTSPETTDLMGILNSLNQNWAVSNSPLEARCFIRRILPCPFMTARSGSIYQIRKVSNCGGKYRTGKAVRLGELLRL